MSEPQSQRNYYATRSQVLSWLAVPQSQARWTLNSRICSTGQNFFARKYLKLRDISLLAHELMFYCLTIAIRTCTVSLH